MCQLRRNSCQGQCHVSSPLAYLQWIAGDKYFTQLQWSFYIANSVKKVMEFYQTICDNVVQFREQFYNAIHSTTGFFQSLVLGMCLCVYIYHVTSEIKQLTVDSTCHLWFNYMLKYLWKRYIDNESINYTTTGILMLKFSAIMLTHRIIFNTKHKSRVSSCSFHLLYWHLSWNSSWRWHIFCRVMY